MDNDDKASKIVEQIFAQKLELETQGKKPRLVLLDQKVFDLLESQWLQSAESLPWGDSLVYEIRMRRTQRGTIFLGDGSLLGLWIVKVETIEGFKVF